MEAPIGLVIKSNTKYGEHGYYKIVGPLVLAEEPDDEEGWEDLDDFEPYMAYKSLWFNGGKPVEVHLDAGWVKDVMEDRNGFWKMSHIEGKVSEEDIKGMI